VAVQLRAAVLGHVPGEAGARRDHVAEPEVQLLVLVDVGQLALGVRGVGAHAEVEREVVVEPDPVWQVDRLLVGLADRVLVELEQPGEALEELPALPDQPAGVDHRAGRVDERPRRRARVVGAVGVLDRAHRGADLDLVVDRAGRAEPGHAAAQLVAPGVAVLLVEVAAQAAGVGDEDVEVLGRDAAEVAGAALSGGEADLLEGLDLVERHVGERGAAVGLVEPPGADLGEQAGPIERKRTGVI